ncbi:TPA: hypothetical protein QHL53_003421 [Proteus mirabilis]|nr:hypothetical protein [Proteus mirabilis]
MKMFSVVKSKVSHACLAVGLMAVSAVSMADTKVPDISDYINAETLAPITKSILDVAGLAIGAGFTIMAVVVAAKAGMGLVKGFMSRASS